MIPMLRAYQYVAPIILTPLSFHLWWREYQNFPQVLVAWLIPILWAYIVPGIGTNVCKVWEFDVRWKLGRFRPHHGFVFGGATAMLAWLVHGGSATSAGEVARYVLVLCSTMGFWNLLYETKALRLGLLKVYNQPWAENLGPEAVAMDYAPWFFGGFGAAYGLAVSGFEYIVNIGGVPNKLMTFAYLSIAMLFCVAIPVIGFIRYSLKTHGHSGTKPVLKKK
jgi:ABC-type proline/glycine betaine transport system permease subunit